MDAGAPPAGAVRTRFRDAIPFVPAVPEDNASESVCASQSCAKNRKAMVQASGTTRHVGHLLMHVRPGQKKQPSCARPAFGQSAPAGRPSKDSVEVQKSFLGGYSPYHSHFPRT